jgi:hypothetical protein
MTNNLNFIVQRVGNGTLLFLSIFISVLSFSFGFYYGGAHLARLAV